MELSINIVSNWNKQSEHASQNTYPLAARVAEWYMQIGVTLDIPFTIQHSLFQRPPALLTPCFPLHSEIRTSRYSSEPQAL